MKNAGSGTVASPQPSNGRTQYWREYKRRQRQLNPEASRDVSRRSYWRNKEKRREARAAYMREYRRRLKMSDRNDGGIYD